MACSLLLSGIVEDSIVDGPGLRLSVFVQGCPHHCPGCHNPQTHDFNAGYEMDLLDIFRKYTENPLLAGVTFSGGEPFCQAGPLARLGALIHERGGEVITYTGYLYEDLASRAAADQDIAGLLAVTDLLIDGPYIDSLRSLDSPFRGSSNQRLLLMRSGRSEGPAPEPLTLPLSLMKPCPESADSPVPSGSFGQTDTK